MCNFKKHGLVAHVPPKHKSSGQKREMVKNQPESLVLDFPQLWLRKATSAVGVSPTLVYYIFHDEMHLKSYKFHLWHKLEYKDYEKSWISPIGSLNGQTHPWIYNMQWWGIVLPVNNQINRQWSKSQPYIVTETLCMIMIRKF